ncbi:plasmid partition protein ParG [Serratia ureilytica]|uniref:plasmid partition protein ParG n=1 Tax=Serratia ureilytica TaxID=300181 RepID=UPI00191E03D8|nr:plasmid partition protein ParG [Serratia ureilytica]MBL0881508.1 DNA partition complex ParG [Serratia ureilytica]MDN2473773.1 DNA partition complex ParG [Serratia ureilytica]
MALQKQQSGTKMSFGEHRDLEKVVTAVVPSGKQKRVNVNFDEDKHIRFKAACAKRGLSISDVIKELVDDWLKNNE